jgi:hypothetical protein
MRYTLAVIVVLLALVAGPIAQNPTVTWLSFSSGAMSVGSGTACPAPSAGTTVYCGTQVSANGAAYATLQGPPGTMSFPITNISITCPQGSGSVPAGFTSHKCTITSP